MAVDNEVLEPLVERAAAGDDEAWRALWQLVHPELERIVAHRSFLGMLGASIDDRRNIVLLVMERLAADRRARLGSYVRTKREKPTLRFMTWLRVVAKRVGIDYQRGHAEYVDRRRQAVPASSPGTWISPEPLPSGSQLGERPPFTDAGTAHELLAFAAETMTDDQRRALELWMQSLSFDAIAERLGMSASDAERKVRAALERLRRHVRGGDPDAG